MRSKASSQVFTLPSFYGEGDLWSRRDIGLFPLPSTRVFSSDFFRPHLFSLREMVGRLRPRFTRPVWLFQLSSSSS